MDIRHFTVIPAFPSYMADENGRVYSTLSNKILSPRIRNDSGYLFVTMLTEDKVSKNILVNRLVAHTFLGMTEIYNDFEVHHIDANILNNNKNNLEVLSKEEHHLKTLAENNYTKRDKNYCLTCNIRIDYRATYCMEHYVPARKRPDITIEEIEEHVRIKGWTNAAKCFNMSDNGLRSNYKRLGGEPSLLRKIPKRR